MHVRSVSDDARVEYRMGTGLHCRACPSCPCLAVCWLFLNPRCSCLSGLGTGCGAGKGREEGALMTLRGGAGRACGAAAAPLFCHVERQARKDDPRASHNEFRCASTLEHRRFCLLLLKKEKYDKGKKNMKENKGFKNKSQRGVDVRCKLLEGLLSDTRPAHHDMVR